MPAYAGRLQVSNSILWFAFLKAMYRATLGRWIAGRITFKVTAKGLQRIAEMPIRWGHGGMGGGRGGAGGGGQGSGDLWAEL